MSRSQRQHPERTHRGGEPSTTAASYTYDGGVFVDPVNIVPWTLPPQGEEDGASDESSLLPTVPTSRVPSVRTTVAEGVVALPINSAWKCTNMLARRWRENSSSTHKLTELPRGRGRGIIDSSYPLSHSFVPFFTDIDL
jgi:hypothetical protein